MESSTPSLAQREPVAIGTAIIGIATAVIAFLMGLHVIDREVGAALNGLVTVCVPLIIVLVRKKTWTESSVQNEVAAAEQAWSNTLHQLQDANAEREALQALPDTPAEEN